MIPTKKQWKRWSLPSKMTAVGFYVTVLSVFVSLISFTSIRVFQHLSTKYDVIAVVPTSKFLKEKMAGAYEQRKENININYPQITHPLKNDFYSRVNQEIAENALTYINEYLIEYEFTFSVGISNKQLLSLVMTQYYFYHLAMNPNSSMLSINIDPSTHQTIDFFDIFDARRDALAGIKAELAEQIEKNCSLFSNAFDKNSYIPRFFIHSNGVAFIFSQYEVTPGVCGSFHVDLNYETLVPYIRPNGPLATMVPTSGEWQAGDHFTRGVMKSFREFRGGNLPDVERRSD